MITPEHHDPHAWLEDVLGDDALAWVRQRNEIAAAELASTPRFTEMKDQIRDIFDAKDNIPAVAQRGEYLYNFWTDADNPRGLWRRTTWEEYRKENPSWDVLIDVDQLAKDEGESWVWHGAIVLYPSYSKALILLSPGGSDAEVVREFCMETRTFVTDGFNLPEGKSSISWADSSGDVVFVGHDFGPDSLTKSGYPRTARRWQRGQSLEDAPEIFQGIPDDIAVSVGHDFTPGFERNIAHRAVDMFNSETYLFDGDTPRKLDFPLGIDVSLHKEWILARNREAWSTGEHEWEAGSLLAIPLADFLDGSRSFTPLFEPTPTTALMDVTATKNHLVLTITEDVVNRLEVLTHRDGEWHRQPVDLSKASEIPRLASVDVSAVDSITSDDLWLYTTDFVTPSTLSLVTLSDTGETLNVEPLKSAPAFFDGQKYRVEQHFATSADGTRVPYFVVSNKDATGPQPALLYGYGGFEVPLFPVYAPSIGCSWLERGGTYVLANGRGGGEYGPSWHTAALKENRHRAYEDFSAVAKDIVAKGITTPEKLGIQGGSNGGLLMGVMYTLYPELFGAIVCQVPLLDMKRYSHLLAGASWRAEYGDPDTDDWEYIKTFSPYHLLDEEKDYPPLFLTTSTKDDRVHPAHARKFQAALEEMGKDTRYYENTEGGHSGAADNEQRAYMQALAWEFLWQQLGDQDAEG